MNIEKKNHSEHFEKDFIFLINGQRWGQLLSKVFDWITITLGYKGNRWQVDYMEF